MNKKSKADVDIGKQLQAWFKTGSDKSYLKQRVNIQCKCKKQKTREKDRVKYGTCVCDSYSLHHTLGNVMANYLFQYIADAKPRIVRDDWYIIELHANSIRLYATADNFDKYSKDKKEKREYLKKEKDWKIAMTWLTNNWNSLWW